MADDKEKDVQNVDSKTDKQANCVKENKKFEPAKQTKKEESKKGEKSKSSVAKQNKGADGKKRGIVTRTIAVVIILGIIIGLIYVALPSPARVLQEMLRELKSGNYEKVNEYVDYNELSNIPIFSKENSDERKEAEKLFFEELQFNIKKINKEGDKATIEIEVTNKNYKTVIQNYTQKVMQKILSSEEINVEEILMDELKNKDIDKVTSIENITVQKQDGKWKVVVDDNLKKAIFPNLEEALEAITGSINP